MLSPSSPSIDARSTAQRRIADLVRSPRGCGRAGV